MTAEVNTSAFTPADAPPHDAPNWHAIDWQKVMRNVRRIQARIVKATQAGNWRKVRALQRLLNHSFSGRALAVRRVTENKGKRTAGVDGELWNTPAQKAKGIERLKQKRYRAQPLKRVYIPKSDGKRQRALGIPCLIDRTHQALHALGLDPIAATTGDPNSYGFLRERSPADAIQQLFCDLAQKGCASWIWEIDIRACFDELSHPWLLKHIPVDKRSLRQWLKAGYMESGVFHHTEAGSPQGGCISPSLANLALDGLEPLLKRHYPRHRGLKVHLVRYADDMVITCQDRDVLAREIKPLVEAFFQERGLSLSEEKSRITHIDEGFDFLGQHIRKYKGQLLIKPAQKSQQALLGKVRTILKKDGQYLSAYGLIQRLNPVIRGWANYHRHVASKRAFVRIDHQIHLALWRWAKRRHPNKSVGWILNKYFEDTAAQRKAFHTHEVNSQGQKVAVRLIKAADTPIQRHTKVRKDANPYDPAWEVYFEQRLYNQGDDDLWDRPRLRHQWRIQQGRCPVCGALITQETGWHNHHIHWRVYGGSEELENRVLLHPHCHRQVHSPEYNGPSLRPSIMGV